MSIVCGAEPTPASRRWPYGLGMPPSFRSPAPVNLCETDFFANHCVVASSSFGGSLIQATVGSVGGVGGLRTKRSGCAA